MTRRGTRAGTSTWLRRRHSGRPAGEARRVPPDVERDAALLRDQATVVGAQAAQLGNRVGHLAAQIELLDDQIGRGHAPPPRRDADLHGSGGSGDAAAHDRDEELRARRSRLAAELAETARRVDVMLGERERLLEQLDQLSSRYGLPATRFHAVSDGVEEDLRRSRARRQKEAGT